MSFTSTRRINRKKVYSYQFTVFRPKMWAMTFFFGSLSYSIEIA
ncbi:MAG: hypothetical protein AB7E45_03340 [Candidatus Caldatribacteriota bacterium]